MFDSVNFIACYQEICKGVTFIGTQCTSALYRVARKKKNADDVYERLERNRELISRVLAR